MSLYDQMRTDNADILTNPSGLALQMTAENALGQSVSAAGRLTEPGIAIDENGLPVITHSVNIAVNLSELATISSGVNETFENWIFYINTPHGETFVGRFKSPIINRTFGYVHGSLIKKE